MQLSPHPVKSMLKAAFMSVNHKAVYSCLHAFSLLCLLSHSLTHTHTLTTVYIHWSITQLSSLCCMEPMQRNHIHSMDHSLIQSHANTFTFSWPCVHVFSHYHRHMLPCHYINAADILLHDKKMPLQLCHVSSLLSVSPEED